MYMMCFLVLYYYYYLYIYYYIIIIPPHLYFNSVPSLGSTTTNDNCIHYSTTLLTMETSYNTADNGTGNGDGFKQCT